MAMNDDNNLTDHELPDESDMDPSSADSVDLVPCPYCKAMVYEQADVCPECGSFIFHDEESTRRPRWFFITVIICIIIAFLWSL